MQDPVYGLPRTPLTRTWVNRRYDARSVDEPGYTDTVREDFDRIADLSEAEGWDRRVVSWGPVVRGAAKHLEDHPKVALRCEVRDPGAAELTAEDHVVLTLGPRNSLIEVRCGDGDVMYALTFLSKETGIDAFLVEWLDKLPHHLADRGDGDARGALDRLTVLAVVIRVTGVDLSEFPRADPIFVHVPPYRRLEIAYDDPQLHRFVEDGLSHCSPPLSR